MASRRTKGPVCGVENCRSRLYDEGEDGFLYCQNGHRQGGLVRGEDDEDDYTPAARTITRKKKDAEEEVGKVARHFTGRRAFDLYLKCLQLILRHQVWFLVHTKELPSELELIMFDLWALRIAQFGNRIASSQDTDSQSQVFNTLESEESLTTDDERTSIVKAKGRKDRPEGAPNLYDILALCYIGICTLRLPITPGDIYAWVTDGKMAFQRAIKLVPLPMRDRLPPTYHAVLDPRTMFKFTRFYDKLTKLHIDYEMNHGILWPALNIQLLLVRYMKELALPLEIYDVTLRLGDLLGYDFAFHYDGLRRPGVRHLPEAQLIGCIVVCVKLFYPFDKAHRHPQSSSEPTAVTFDWENWCTEINTMKQKKHNGNLGFTTEALLKLKEEDAMRMTSDQLDQYLDFYADIFLDEAEIQRSKENDDFRNALYGMFSIDSDKKTSSIPLSEGPAEEIMMETVKAVHSQMKPNGTVADEEGMSSPLRPGQMYPLWKKESDLPENAKYFYEAAGRLAGLSMDMLIMAVFFTEVRVEKWRRKQRMRARAKSVDV